MRADKHFDRVLFGLFSELSISDRFDSLLLMNLVIMFD